MYKGFALAVLLIAPLLVMLADSFAPKQAAAPVAVQGAAPPKSAMIHDKAWADTQAQAAAAPATPRNEAGTPMADAGKPMLDLDQKDEAAPATDATPAAPPTPSTGPVNPDAQRNQPAPGANLTAEWKNDRR